MPIKNLYNSPNDPKLFPSNRYSISSDNPFSAQGISKHLGFMSTGIGHSGYNGLALSRFGGAEKKLSLFGTGVTVGGK